MVTFFFPIEPLAYLPRFRPYKIHDSWCFRLAHFINSWDNISSLSVAYFSKLESVLPDLLPKLSELRLFGESCPLPCSVLSSLVKSETMRKLSLLRIGLIENRKFKRHLARGFIGSLSNLTSVKLFITTASQTSLATCFSLFDRQLKITEWQSNCLQRFGGELFLPRRADLRFVSLVSYNNDPIGICIESIIHNFPNIATFVCKNSEIRVYESNIAKNLSSAKNLSLVKFACSCEDALQFFLSFYISAKESPRLNLTLYIDEINQSFVSKICSLYTDSDLLLFASVSLITNKMDDVLKSSLENAIQSVSVKRVIVRVQRQ